jgi:hypothetical protein
MLQLVATFKPIDARGWSQYARVLLTVARADGATAQGPWRWLNGPLLPFSLQTPDARSGDWVFAGGTINFLTPDPDDFEADPLPVMMFNRVPGNFLVSASHHDLQGKGARRIGPDESIQQAEKLIWVIGPGMGRGQKKGQDYGRKDQDYDADRSWGLTGRANRAEQQYQDGRTCTSTAY